MDKFSQIKTQISIRIIKLLDLGDGLEFLEVLGDLDLLVKDLSKEHYKKPSAEEFINQSDEVMRKEFNEARRIGRLEDIERNKAAK